MESRPREIWDYCTEDGKIPFRIWLHSLKNIKARVKIEARIERAEDGNLGECNFVGNGVHEMKIDFGPGYRVYFGQDGTKIIILLCGGDKSTQPKDTKKAQEYWADYNRR